MADRILEGFLMRQLEQGMALAEESDLLDLIPLPGPLPQRYIARFLCRGLVRGDDGEVRPADRFEVGIHFPSDYLRRANAFEVLTWLGPSNIHHPNIMSRAGAICVGRLAPGTDLVSLLYQLFEIITYRRVTVNERDALDWEACRWARNHPERLPVDSRPLKRRRMGLEIEITHREDQSDAQS
jgi:hypothetical protein